MKLDAVTVRSVPVLDQRAGSAMNVLGGMGVLVPPEHDDAFLVGKSYQLSQGRERYRVLILEKHATSSGVCVFLKQWEPN